MPQFFVERVISIAERVEITGSDARHITASLRLGSGDEITLSRGDGRSFKAVIESASLSSVILRVTKERAIAAGNPPPVLALALAKRTRFEWAVQKVVELGCKRIIPFHSSRTVVKVDRSSKVDRWRQIAIEAAKQSGLPFIPEIEKPIPFSTLTDTASSFDQSIIFHEGESTTNISEIKPKNDSPTLLAIGPEGGFSNEEIENARSSGMEVAGLGDQILRVETAAIAVVTIWQYELGNM